MKTQIYRCTNRTEATDKANLYYIQVNASRTIKDDRETKTIQIGNRHGNILAIFAY